MNEFAQGFLTGVGLCGLVWLVGWANNQLETKIKKQATRAAQIEIEKRRRRDEQDL